MLQPQPGLGSNMTIVGAVSLTSARAKGSVWATPKPWHGPGSQANRKRKWKVPRELWAGAEPEGGDQGRGRELVSSELGRDRDVRETDPEGSYPAGIAGH